ncbi:MAG: hypothetical protein WAZ18_00435 [Alphaproteobacteria bacterium]
MHKPSDEVMNRNLRSLGGRASLQECQTYWRQLGTALSTTPHEPQSREEPLARGTVSVSLIPARLTDDGKSITD